MPCPFKEFETVVIQPRAQHRDGPIRLMRWELQDIMNFEARALEAIHNNLRGDAAPTPGKDQCKYCRAQKAGTCKEYLTWAATAGIPASIGPITEKSIQQMLEGKTLAEMPVEDLAEMKNMEPIFKALTEAVNAEIKARLNHGTRVPGWKLGQVDGRPKWTLAEKDLRKQLRNLGLKPAQFSKNSLLTPLQTMKAKGITSEQAEGVSMLWSRGQPTWKVVEDTHPADDSMAWMRTIPGFEG